MSKKTDLSKGEKEIEREYEIWRLKYMFLCIKKA